MDIAGLVSLVLWTISSFIVPAVIALWSFIIIYIIVRVLAYRTKLKIIANQGINNEYGEKVWDIISTIIIYIWLTFNILIVFQILWIDVSLLMAGVSFWIWFAMQEVLENLIAWFLILTNPMMKVGETISILGQFNVFWKIESLQSRYIVIRQFNRRKLIIPNVKFLKTPVKTYKRETIVRWEVKFRVEHKVPVDRLQAVILKEVNNYEPLINKEQTQVLTTVIRWEATKFMIYFYINPQSGQSVVRTKSELMKIIIKTLRKYNVRMPYPKTTLDFE